MKKKISYSDITPFDQVSTMLMYCWYRIRQLFFVLFLRHKMLTVVLTLSSAEVDGEIVVRGMKKYLQALSSRTIFNNSLQELYSERIFKRCRRKLFLIIMFNNYLQTLSLITIFRELFWRSLLVETSGKRAVHTFGVACRAAQGGGRQGNTLILFGFTQYVRGVDWESLGLFNMRRQSRSGLPLVWRQYVEMFAVHSARGWGASEPCVCRCSL